VLKASITLSTSVGFNGIHVYSGLAVLRTEIYSRDILYSVDDALCSSLELRC